VSNQQKVIVFGSQRIAANWAAKHHRDLKDVLLATDPDKIQGLKGPFIVVRVSKVEWVPPTFACEKRVQITEDWITQEEMLRKVVEKNGGNRK
jgi:hypothetical protein